MNTDKFRSLLAWSFGIISSVLVYLALTKLSSEMGLETYVDSDEMVTWDIGSYTNDDEGYSTALGTWIKIISITVGARLGMALFAKRWDGGSEKKSILLLSLIMLGMTAYAALVTVSWKTIPSEMLEHENVRLWAEISVVAGLYWLLSRFYREKCFEWDQEENNQPFSHNALPEQNGVVRSSPMEDKTINVLPKQNAALSPSQIENEPISVLPEQVAVVSTSPEDNAVVSVLPKEAHIEEDDKVDLDFLNSLIAKSTGTSSIQAPFVLKEEKPLKKSNSSGKNKRKEKQANRKSKPRKLAKNLETETRLYVAQTPFSEPNGNVVIKIGESTNIEERIKTFKFYWRDKFKILALAPGKVKDEAELHKALLSRHIGGEYFSVHPKQIPAASPQMSKKALLNWLGEILYEN